MPAPRPVPTSADIARVADAMRTARRPLLLAGGGVARSGGTEAFRALVARTGFAATTSPKGLGIVDISAPDYFGSGGWLGGHGLVKACAEADLIVAIGCKFSTWMPIGKPPQHPVPAGQKIIHIDIDPLMLGKNVPLDIGLVGDARETLILLDAALTDVPLSAERGWIGDLVAEYRGFLAEADEIADRETTEGTGLLNAAAVGREVRRHAPRDAVFCFDGGQIAHWAIAYGRPISPNHVTFNAGMGHMGNGLPQAVGAKLARPDLPVIAVTGDGAAGCTIQELETAARVGANIVVIIFNDSHWGAYRPLRDHVLHNEALGTKLTDVDFAAVARGFGCLAERVTRIAELAPALARALAADRPFVIDVVGDFTPAPTDRYWGWTMAGLNVAQYA